MYLPGRSGEGRARSKILRVTVRAGSPCPMTPDFGVGLLVGFALALPLYLLIDSILDHLTRQADGVEHDWRP